MKSFLTIRRGVSAPNWLPPELKMLCETSESRVFKQGESKIRKNLTVRTAPLCSKERSSSRMLLRKRWPGYELKNKKRCVMNVLWNKNKDSTKSLRSISICRRSSK